MDSLHFTHMSAYSTLKIAKGSFVWPGLKNDLGIKYTHCEACLVNAKQKIDKPDQIPQYLTSLFPGEQLSVDFAEIFNKDILLIVDKVSSHVYGEITRDKTFESMKKVMENYFHTYTLPYQVTSDNGPYFRNKWSSWMDSMNITTHFTSPYRSQSNGLIEKTVGKVKNSLERIGQISKDILSKVVCEIISTPHQDGTDSPSSKYFGRGVRSYLPNSVNREIERRQLVKKRQDA